MAREMVGEANGNPRTTTGETRARSSATRRGSTETRFDPISITTIDSSVTLTAIRRTRLCRYPVELEPFCNLLRIESDRATDAVVRDPALLS